MFDWMVLCRALSEVLGAPLPYDDLLSLRDRMWDTSPTLLRYDTIETPSTAVAQLGFASLVDTLKDSQATAKDGAKFTLPVENFYMTDAISRSSVTMAQCSRGKLFSPSSSFFLLFVPRPITD